jgi:hypothetical protein
MGEKKAKKYAVFFLKTGLAILAIWYLFKSGRLTEESLIRLFKATNLPFFILSAVFFFLSQILCSIRLILLLKMINLPLRIVQGFKLTMIGNFFNMVIPGTVGGDIIKALYLFKNEEDSRGRSSGIIVMDRVLGLLALFLLAGISIIYLAQRYKGILSSYHNELYIILISIAVVLSLFMGLFFFGRNERIRQKLKNVIFTLFRKGIFYHMAEGFGAISKNRQLLIHSLLISILVQLFSLTGLLILLNLIRNAFSEFISLAAVSSIVMLLGVVPVTPGNIGWTELIAAVGWSAVGSNTGAEIFFYWRVVIIFCSLIGAFLYYTPLKIKSP